MIPIMNVLSVCLFVVSGDLQLVKLSTDSGTYRRLHHGKLKSTCFPFDKVYSTLTVKLENVVKGILCSMLHFRLFCNFQLMKVLGYPATMALCGKQIIL